jgi:hypothetical protein
MAAILDLIAAILNLVAFSTRLSMKTLYKMNAGCVHKILMNNNEN